MLQGTSANSGVDTADDAPSQRPAGKSMASLVPGIGCVQSWLIQFVVLVAVDCSVPLIYLPQCWLHVLAQWSARLAVSGK